jgi:hypothetical protein
MLSKPTWLRGKTVLEGAATLAAAAMVNSARGVENDLENTGEGKQI